MDAQAFTKADRLCNRRVELLGGPKRRLLTLEVRQQNRLAATDSSSCNGEIEAQKCVNVLIVIHNYFEWMLWSFVRGNLYYRCFAMHLKRRKNLSAGWVSGNISITAYLCVCVSAMYAEREII